MDCTYFSTSELTWMQQFRALRVTSFVQFIMMASISSSLHPLWLMSKWSRSFKCSVNLHPQETGEINNFGTNVGPRNGDASDVGRESSIYTKLIYDHFGVNNKVQTCLKGTQVSRFIEGGKMSKRIKRYLSFHQCRSCFFPINLWKISVEMNVLLKVSDRQRSCDNDEDTRGGMESPWADGYLGAWGSVLWSEGRSVDHSMDLHV